MGNPTGIGGWQKGQSGNPKGRPPKARALTALLEAAGSKTEEHEGKKIARKRLMVERLWRVVHEGRLEINGKAWSVTPEVWLETVKWIYAQVDGAPKQDINLQGDGRVIFEFVDDWRGRGEGPAAEPAPGPDEGAA